MKNKLICIGYVGIQTCYLNMAMDEAILRYCQQENMTAEEFSESDISVYEVDFDDEFEAYNIWEK